VPIASTRLYISIFCTVAVLMLFALVAWPAWQRYRVRLTTTEATMNVRRLYDASVSYYDADFFDQRATPLPRQFPGSVEATPELTAIGPDGYASDPALWSHPTWRTLDFETVGPSHYAYEYESAGTGLQARFSASAAGDPDGDGELFLAVRTGGVAQGNEIRGGAGLRQEHIAVEDLAGRSFLPPEPTSNGGVYTRPSVYPSALVPPTVEVAPVERVAEDSLLTFSIDVDTASYTVARASLNRGRLPDQDAVRIEEFLNYMDYDYPAPSLDDEVPFEVHVESAPSPFGDELQLLRVAVQGADIAPNERLPANLVFLIDVSGSMSSADKLGRVQDLLRGLTNWLDESDTVGVVLYAGRAGVALEPTAVEDRDRILDVIDGLSAGGSTNGAGGMHAAYDLAARAYRAEGLNRVIWATDGDFNVGATGEELLALIEDYREQGIYLTTLGFGSTHGERRLERLSNHGDGTHHFIDSDVESRRVVDALISGSMQTIARDVKIQVEMNGDVIDSYRRIGYDNREIADADFRNDAVDAGEVAAGESVTALIELALRDGVEPGRSAERLVTVRLRYEPSEGGEAIEVAIPFEVSEMGRGLAASSSNFRFAAAVAELGEILRHSPHSQGARFDDVEALAATAYYPHRRDQLEFVELASTAGRLWGSL